MFNGTWTWNGTTWTKQSPATSRPARYFAARWPTTRPPATSVLFGGDGTTRTRSSDTWTFDGSTWTQQFPADQPAGRGFGASMAYDAATGNIVLFGGSPTAAICPTPGPGTGRPGPSSSRRQPSGPLRCVDGLRRGLGQRRFLRRVWPYTATLVRHLDLERLTWTQQHPATKPVGSVPRGHDLRLGHRQRGPFRGEMATA